MLTIFDKRYKCACSEISLKVWFGKNKNPPPFRVLGVDVCSLTTDTPVPKHTRGYMSSSPEFRNKIEKNRVVSQFG